MKREVLMFLILALCSPVLAGIADDGLIEDGEYTYDTIFLNNQNLLVTGGGRFDRSKG